MKMNLKAALVAIAACTMLAGASMSVLAAEPNEVSVEQDYKGHKVVVYGTALALVKGDGTIEITPIGQTGLIDVMVDGKIQTGVTTCTIPDSKSTAMILEEGSIVVKNLTAEEAAAVKAAVQKSIADGVSEIEPASIGAGTAYKVNESGDLTDALGRTVWASVSGVNVTSVEEATVSFTEEIEAIRQADEIAAAEAKAREAAALDSAAQESEESGASVCPVDGTPLEKSENAMFCPTCNGWYEGSEWKTPTVTIIEEEIPEDDADGSVAVG